jgi:beta-glucosidase
MPWQSAVPAILEAWYSGTRGGQAIANILFGVTSPSGRLPITFPAALAQLPRPVLPGEGQAPGTAFIVNYTEGSDVGYRWYAARHQAPLYPFGYGLAYTSFRLSSPRVLPGPTPRVTLSVTNTGARAGTDTPQLYLTAAPRRRQQRLLGWARVTLAPGETRNVTIDTDPRLLADWDQPRHRWSIAAGIYHFALGESATALSLTATVSLPPRTLPP